MLRAGAGARRARDAAARVERVVADTLRSGDLLAGFAPDEYQVLLLDCEPDAARRSGGAVVAALAEQGVSPRAGLALYPADGTSPQALVACARHALIPIDGLHQAENAHRRSPRLADDLRVPGQIDPQPMHLRRNLAASQPIVDPLPPPQPVTGPHRWAHPGTRLTPR